MLSFQTRLDNCTLVVGSKLPPFRNISGVLTLQGDQAGIKGFRGQFLRSRLLELDGSISKIYSDPRMVVSFKGDLDLKGLLSLLKAKQMPTDVRKALDPIRKISGRATIAGEIRHALRSGRVPQRQGCPSRPRQGTAGQAAALGLRPVAAAVACRAAVSPTGGQRADPGRLHVLVRSQCDPCPGEECPQVTHVVLAAGSTVMRFVELPFDLVQHDPDPGSVTVINLGAQMIQERLYFPPVDIAARRFPVDGSD